MDDAGSIAAVGANFEYNIPALIPAAGAVGIWERDPGTGQWSMSLNIYDPTPGYHYGFGNSVDMTPDGSIVVIGRAAGLGTDTLPLPDAVYVLRRDGGGWSEPISLVADPPVENREQFGHAVVINNAGDTIAVGAPGNNIGLGITGEVYIFRDLLGAWTHTETIHYSEPTASFSFFGTAMAFAGDELLASDPAVGLYDWDPEVRPALLVFDGSDGLYGPTPDAEIRVPLPLGYGRGLGSDYSVRGDTALVGAPAEGSVMGFGVEAGAVFRVKRVNGEWSFVLRTEAEAGQEFANFGEAVAIADNLVDLVIGEPSFEPDFEHWEMGRVHLTGQVFREAPFQIATAESTLALELAFPGVPLQYIALLVGGGFEFAIPEMCEATDPITQLQLIGASLTTADEPVEIEIAPGVVATISSIELALAEPVTPATLDSLGNGYFEDTEFVLSGDISIGDLPPYPVSEPVRVGILPILVEGDGAQGLSIEIPSWGFVPEIDVGLGDGVPAINATIDLTAAEADPPCSAADLAEPFGVLDLADITAFVSFFLDADPRADLAAPQGVWDLADLVGFVTLFVSGCP
jgi:hypothetical protein